MKRRLILLAGLVFFLVLVAWGVLADGTEIVQVKVVIPPVLRLEATADLLVFDLGRAGYPPVRFPAYYAPEGKNGAEGIPLRVFSNTNRAWTLVMTLVSPLTGPNGTLPTDRLEWSTDRVRWTPMQDGMVTITTGNRTTGWQEGTVYFRLRVEGDEPGADQPYTAVIAFTLLTS